MLENRPSSEAQDPHDLQRFIDAQQDDYDRALSEVRGGRKQTHWMWYIFPQIDGLGFSSTSRRYSIKNLAEATAYLQHPILGVRLRECFVALLGLNDLSAHEIFGSPDDVKLCSCATLFDAVSDGDSLFAKVIDQYCRGQRDQRTLQLIKDVHTS